MTACVRLYHPRKNNLELRLMPSRDFELYQDQAYFGCFPNY